MALSIQENYRVPLTLLLAYTIAYLASYLFNVFLANVLGASMYGDYSLGMRILSVVAPIILLGTTSSSRRFIANYLVSKQQDDVTKYVVWNTRLFLCMSAVTIALITLSIIILIALHVYNLQDIKTYHIVIYLLYAAPILGLTQLSYSILLAFNRYSFATYVSNVAPYFLMNLFLLLLWLYVRNIHSILIAGVVLLAYLCVNLVMILYMHYKIPELNLTKIFLSKEKINKKSSQEWLGTAKRFMFNGIVFTCINAIDLLTIELVLDNENLVGYYAATLMITKIILLIRVGFNAYISVKVSQLINEKAELQSMFKKVSTLQLCIIAILCLLLLLFSNTLLLHFGTGFLEAKIPLEILIIGTGIAVFLTPGSMALLYSGNEKTVLLTNSVTLISYVIVCPIMTYYFGLVGTAITSAILETVPRFVIACIARHLLQVRTCWVV